MAMTGIVLTSGYAQAQATDTFPTKAIKLVVPFAPGGVTDTSGRIVTERLSKRLGHYFGNQSKREGKELERVGRLG
jgi:tripartite-type tricarboxylate transporter receptor subunit TctC